MARPLRFQYAGAIYHVMARGDGGRAVFMTDRDRKSFMFRLGQVCESHGWRVHAWVLMRNHFHLLLETPEANLVSGMKYLLGTFSQSWNHARQRRGHVFQGRYKSVPVTGEDAGTYYFRIVADYIHLNPARAGLAGGKRGPLVNYSWSSLPCYLKGNGPSWLAQDRVLRAFELSPDGKGRRAYVNWLEARAENKGGKIDDKAMGEIRRGWYLGGKEFKTHLLGMLPDSLPNPYHEKNGGDPARRDHAEEKARQIIQDGSKLLDLPLTPEGLAILRKGDERKVLLATLLRERTTVSNGWIAENLLMGHPGSVSRMVCATRSDASLERKKMKIVKDLSL